MNDASPRAVIFAGPNGSGKSTLLHDLQNRDPTYVPALYINADDIARDMTTGTQLEKEKSAFQQARQLREDYRISGVSFSFETVFSHPSTLLDLLKLKAAGYEVIFVFVATQNAQTNALRVQQRFKSGGHDVPLDKILSRYERALSFLPLAAEIADQTVVWDNTTNLRRVCNVEAGNLNRTYNNTPFYEERFILPFTAHQKERDALYQHYPDLEAAEIQSGVYKGTFIEVINHYAVQAAQSQAILHDRTLLTSKPLPNQAAQIVYRDGYGTPA